MSGGQWVARSASASTNTPFIQRMKRYGPNGQPYLIPVPMRCALESVFSGTLTCNWVLRRSNRLTARSSMGGICRRFVCWCVCVCVCVRGLGCADRGLLGPHAHAFACHTHASAHAFACAVAFAFASVAILAQGARGGGRLEAGTETRGAGAALAGRVRRLRWQEVGGLSSLRPAS